MIPYNKKIEMNFHNDMKEIVKSSLLNTGIEFKSKMDSDDWNLMFQYFNLIRRLISKEKRNVHYSKEFVCPDEFKSIIKDLDYKLSNGINVFDHLSKNILRLNYNDLMLNDWGIYHLHLGSKPDKKDNRFVERKNELLFLRIDEGNAYFINVMKHGDWNKLDILRCIHKNWPESIEKYRAKGFSVVGTKLDDNKVKTIRQSKMCTLYEVEPDVSYFPPGGGMVSTGASIDIVRYADWVSNSLHLFEIHIKSNIDIYVQEIKNKIGKEPDSLDFKLTINENSEAFAFEVNSVSFFKLGDL